VKGDGAVGDAAGAAHHEEIVASVFGFDASNRQRSSLTKFRLTFLEHRKNPFI